MAKRAVFMKKLIGYTGYSVRMPSRGYKKDVKRRTK